MGLEDIRRRLAEFSASTSVEFEDDCIDESRRFLEHLENQGYVFPRLYKTLLLGVGGIEFEEPLIVGPANEQSHDADELELIGRGAVLLSRSVGSGVAELGVLSALPIQGGDWWFDELPEHYIHIGWFCGQGDPDSDIAIFLCVHPNHPRSGHLCAVDMCEAWDDFEDVVIDTSFHSFWERLMPSSLEMA